MALLRPFVRRPMLLAAMLLLDVTIAAAQGGTPPSRAASPASAGGEIRGRLIAAGSGQPITGGSVAVRRGAATAFAGGALPRADGTFVVEGLAPGTYSVRFRALGYAPLVKADIVVSASQRVTDLGVVTLTQVASQIAGQAVVAERDEVELAPDRNSYATKNMTNAAGGTAVDVLRNVPSVEVDGTNKVSLRGNENVVIQINGRSSPLRGEQLGNFLAQLPSSAVSRVEVATNPSARNDPEGTAGIVNIILTQQTEVGLSGGATFGTGTTGLANGSGNIGKQVGPWTLFTSASLFRDARPLSGKSERSNLSEPVPAFANSRVDGRAKPRSGTLTLRSEYQVKEGDALAFDAVMSTGRFARDNDSYYTNLDVALDTLGLFNQFSEQLSRNNTQDYTLAYRRTGKPTATTFSTELRHTRSNFGSDNLLTNVLVRSDASTGASSRPAERNVTDARMPSYVLQADLTRPFSSGTKLETGYKGTLRSTENDFDATALDAASGEFVPLPGRANAFEYREQINAAYAVVSQQVKKLQAQAGLRVEQADTRLSLPLASQGYDRSYASLFPSGLLSYNLTATRQVKASYSRRISRPDPQQLNPIQFNEDARNVFRGNPDLQPEYTDAFELGFQESRSWGSIQLNPYLRQTDDAVRFIRSVDTSGVTVSTFANVASSRTVGSDLNVTVRRGALTLFGGGSAFQYTSEAGALSTDAFSWSARSNVSYKAGANTDLQLFANYRAPTRVEGGRQIAFIMTNFSLRQKLWGEKGGVTVRVSDPFNLTKFGFRTEDARVVELTERRWGMRGVFLTFNRSFGQQLKLRPRQDGDPGQQAAPPGSP